MKLLISWCFIIFFTTFACTSQEGNNADFFSLDDKNNPVAIHTNKLLISQFDSGKKVDFFEKNEPENSSFLNVFQDGKITTNYMQASFFIFGDVRGCRIQPPYRTLPIGTDGKRIIWGSKQSQWPLEGLDEKTHFFTPGNENNGHSEPQFISDMPEVFEAESTLSLMKKRLDKFSGEETEEIQKQKILQLNDLVNETLRTDPTQFVPFLREGGNTKINCFGFVLDSTFDICSKCLGNLNTFIKDESRCSLNDFMRQQKERRNISNCDRSRIIVNAAFPYIRTNYKVKFKDQYYEYKYTYESENRKGIFSTSKQSYTGAITWQHVEKDLKDVPVVCRIRSLFQQAQRLQEEISNEEKSPIFNENGKLEFQWS